jgi:hypothetical protein
MKIIRTLLMVTISCISLNVFAQTEMQTLFGKSKNRVKYLGLYVAPEVSYGQFDGGFRPLVGNSVMLSINKKFAVGATASGVLSKRRSNVSAGQFGGLKIEYSLRPDALVHVTFPLLIGAGSVSEMSDFVNYDRVNRRGERFGDSMYSHRDLSFIVQPGVNVEANLFKYTKIFLGANYRLAANQNGYTSDLSGFSSTLGLKFGIFDYVLKKKNKDEVSGEPK